MKYPTLGLATVALLTAGATLANPTTWPDCPTAVMSPPPISATGPYEIEDYGTASATAYGLPNCVAVGQSVDVMLAGIAPDTADASVTLNGDGTYSVTLVR